MLEVVLLVEHSTLDTADLSDAGDVDAGAVGKDKPGNKLKSAPHQVVDGECNEPLYE